MLEIARVVNDKPISLPDAHGLPLPPKTRLAARAAQPYKVTPAVITKQYGISGVTPSAKGNSMAVAEFQGQCE